MFDNVTPEQWGEVAGLLAAATLSSGFSGSVPVGIATYLVGWIVGMAARRLASKVASQQL